MMTMRSRSAFLRSSALFDMPTKINNGAKNSTKKSTHQDMMMRKIVRRATPQLGDVPRSPARPNHR
jgi:hypothetical protein